MCCASDGLSGRPVMSDAQLDMELSHQLMSCRGSALLSVVARRLVPAGRSVGPVGPVGRSVDTRSVSHCTRPASSTLIRDDSLASRRLVARRASMTPRYASTRWLCQSTTSCSQSVSQSVCLSVPSPRPVVTTRD